MIAAGDLARALADRIEALAPELLPGGHREGREWRAGSIEGERGASLGVHLGGLKRGVWADFATGQGGDALDLVAAVFKLDTAAAMRWAGRRLGIDEGAAELPPRPKPAATPAQNAPVADRWRSPWKAARPIAGTLAETCLARRKLASDDIEGRVFRFTERRARRNPASDELEFHPAMLALLRDARSGEPVGIINTFLRPDGSDRLRDSKGRTVTGRAAGAVVMLDDFDAPTMGLTLCEGVTTGCAICQSGHRPVWACGSATTLAGIPVLGGIEALTIAADAGEPGQRAAATLAERWRRAGREVRVVSAALDDWATPL